MSLHLNKAALRSQFIAQRQNQDDGTAEASSRMLARHLVALIPPGSTVAAYRATSGEIDVSYALEELAKKGHTLCLPVTAAHNQLLVFKQWQPGDRLLRGRYNIEIPEDAAKEVSPDVLIVPLVAFDMGGNRLGYGGGYYDRTIASLREAGKNVMIIGAAFTLQGVIELPTEAHDQKLDAIATEQGVLKPKVPQARVS